MMGLEETVTAEEERLAAVGLVATAMEGAG